MSCIAVSLFVANPDSNAHPARSGGWDSYRAGAENKTQAFAMMEWYEAMDTDGPNTAPNEQKTWIQGKAYPCDDCCK